MIAINITVSYPGKAQVLRDFHLEIAAGKIAGLAGSSGCGKSTLALAILGLLGYKGGKVTGSIEFQGRELLGLPESELRRIRGKQISLVMQSPVAALNPALRIGAQMREAWTAHAPESDWKAKSLEAFSEVSLPRTEAFLNLYPRELSVGLAQRVLIAMAILHRPKLLIADEATSALDVITQRDILELFRRLSWERNMSILYISHDLPSVAALCNTTGILKNGELVEYGPTASLFASPRHPYTAELIAALPRIGVTQTQAPDRKTNAPFDDARNRPVQFRL